jgi:hypothetical protein
MINWNPRRSWGSVVVMGVFLGLFGVACSDRRPDEATAKAEFEKRYEDAIALEVRVTEDEVVARSFKVRYRLRTSGREGTLEIQYMEGESGQWVMRPEPPRTLPEP